MKCLLAMYAEEPRKAKVPDESISKVFKQRYVLADVLAD